MNICEEICSILRDRTQSLAGPDGTPLTPALSTSAEPALGARSAAGACRRAAGGSAPALSERTDGTSKNSDCNNGRRHGYFRHQEVFVQDSNDSARRWFPERFPPTVIETASVCDAEDRPLVRKLIAFDDDTFDKLKQLGRDRMATIQELADEAFADVLRKHGVPVDLKDALRKSSSLAKTEPQKNARSSSRKKKS